jgi:hypothetical protein
VSHVRLFSILWAMDQKKPSIEEILAKARQQGAAGGKAQ